MDPRQLRHFLAVADSLHYGRAAERLGMTQPPLSQSILALERELGGALFTRSKRSVALTAFGQQWLEHVRPALAALDELPDIARSLLTGRIGRLTLSFVTTADYNVLPPLVQRHAAAFPAVDLALVEATSDVQTDGLLDGSFDAGILIPSRSDLPSALDYRPLLREPLVAAVPVSWIDDQRLRHQGALLTGQSWMEQPLILFPAHVSPDFHDLIMGYYRQHGRRPVIGQQAIQMQTIISLVSAGIGLALVPQSMRNLARPGVHYLDLPGDAPWLETGIAWRKDNSNGALATLIEIAASSARV